MHFCHCIAFYPAAFLASKIQWVATRHCPSGELTSRNTRALVPKCLKPTLSHCRMRVGCISACPCWISATFLASRRAKARPQARSVLWATHTTYRAQAIDMTMPNQAPRHLVCLPEMLSPACVLTAMFSVARTACREAMRTEVQLRTLALRKRLACRHRLACLVRSAIE
jgi:hypothetical protein